MKKTTSRACAVLSLNVHLILSRPPDDKIQNEIMSAHVCVSRETVLLKSSVAETARNWPKASAVVSILLIGVRTTFTCTVGCCWYCRCSRFHPPTHDFIDAAAREGSVCLGPRINACPLWSLGCVGHMLIRRGRGGEWAKCSNPAGVIIRSADGQLAKHDRLTNF